MTDAEEFKFNKSRNRVRIRFLETIAKYNFRVRSLIVEKEILYSPELHKKESFYAYFIKQALKFTDGTVHNATIKIDGSSDKAFRKSFLGYLRPELNANDRDIVKKCRLADSRSDTLLQAVDMIAGATRRSYEEAQKEYRQLFFKHIEDEWNFS